MQGIRMTPTTWKLLNINACVLQGFHAGGNTLEQAGRSLSFPHVTDGMKHIAPNSLLLYIIRGRLRPSTILLLL